MPLVFNSAVVLRGGGGSMVMDFDDPADGDCGSVLVLRGSGGGGASSRVLTGLSDRSVDGFLGTGGAGFLWI